MPKADRSELPAWPVRGLLRNALPPIGDRTARTRFAPMSYEVATPESVKTPAPHLVDPNHERDERSPRTYAPPPVRHQVRSPAPRLSWQMAGKIPVEPTRKSRAYCTRPPTPTMPTHTSDPG